jgi:FecR protein
MSSPKFRLTATLVVVFCLAAWLSAFADSHVRIVRLSYIEGGVEISHGGTQAYEKAMVNLPIAEAMKIKTFDAGRAEVEFEDGSTIHVVPNSEIAFPQLMLRDSGAKASTIEVTKGTAYVNFMGTKNDEFAVQFANEKIALANAAHLRIDMGEKNSIALFKGFIRVDTPGGAVELKKNQTLSFDASADAQPKLSKNIRQEPFDDWDDQQNEYHTRYAAKSSPSYSPYSYGSSDLAYYGNFFTYPGYGMMWQPFFAGAGWDPFMDGAWSFYPGWGYGWISAYPWGWTPYHYGTWVFLPGRGWAWQPTGMWTSWYSQPQLLNAPKGFSVPRAPLTGTNTVLVSRGAVSTFAGDKLVVRNNSAGLGVPRGEVGNMAKLSERAQQHGTVTQTVDQRSVMMNSPQGGKSGDSPQGRTAGSSRASGPEPRSEPMHQMGGMPQMQPAGGSPPHK